MNHGVLERHRVDVPEQQVFRTSLPGATDISIRFQLELGKSMVEAALKAGVIAPGKRLAVFGAGVAGCSIAVEAASAGVITDLFGPPFLAQARCQTRILHPNQYFWPNEGWSQVTHRHAVFPWSKARSDRVARSWARQLKGWISAKSNQLIHHSRAPGFSNAHNIRTFADFLGCFPSLPPGRAYHMHVIAAGWEEDCRIRGTDYRGWAFWENDQIGKPATKVPRILFSGAGDGALQDFLRTCFKLIPADLMKQIDLQLASSGAESATERFGKVATKCESLLEGFGEISDLEKSKRIADVDSAWRDEVGKFLDRFEEPVWKALRRSALFPLEDGAIRILTKEKVVGRCYPLNRILVLLVLELARRREWNFRLLPERTVTSVTPINHKCQGPDTCWNKPHRVRLSDGTEETFFGIVVRHGVKPRMQVSGG